MEANSDNQFVNDIAPTPARPQFLKVLCILTWICCGLTFFSSLSTIAMSSPEKEQERIESMRQVNPEAADKMEAALSAQSPETRMMNNLLNIIGVALSAFGAVMMWQLKKTGFYLYLAGELLPYFGFVMGGAHALSGVSAMAGSKGPVIIGVVIAMMVIFDLAFIIMYAVNVKYMKK